MATTTVRRKTTTEKGLGWRHRQAVDGLKRRHVDGSPCDWCGRPMYLDRTKNWDYKPHIANVVNGELQGDHSKISRSECMRQGIPIPPPDRLLHQTCNIQRGDGGNDHLAANATGQAAADTEPGVTLLMPWPW